MHSLPFPPLNLHAAGGGLRPAAPAHAAPSPAHAAARAPEGQVRLAREMARNRPGGGGLGHDREPEPVPRAYLLVVLDLILGAVGGREARLLPRQGDALLLNFIRADVSDRSRR